VRVAVVGGGVGGLTAAVALARRGIEVDVYEQSQALAQVGASLQLGPNALRLLADLGLLPALREIGVLPDAVRFVRWDDGSLLLHTDLGPAMEDHFGAPQLDFFRPDLHRVLAGALPSGCLHLGARVVDVEQTDAVALIHLADGSRVDADVVVAADGIRSPLRQLLAGADDPVFSGTVVYRGVVSRADVADLHPEHVNYYWLGPYRHGVSYWISRGELLAVNCAVQDAEWSRESWTLEAPTDEALAAFDGWHEPLRERIRRCPMLLRGAVFVRQPLEHWSYGRVTLLGDAAHAMEPFQAQGAAQAVEDSYVLAACLADTDDVVDALVRYETIRMARAEELQASSRTAANVFYLPDGEEQRARDAAYATLAESQPWGPRQRIWEYDVRDALAQFGALER
jgi:2-polyprenyl-6-methoxyphenol hydroxylase-like FAD-dependent oxidoreductase